MKASGYVVSNLEILIRRNKRFTTIYADPPWAYSNQATRAAAGNHYDTMSVEDIAALPIRTLAAEKSALFIWTTNAFLQDTLVTVIPSWGFEFKSSIIWIKPQMGIGNYVRNSHEFLLIATTGGYRTDGKNQMSWIEARRKQHSEKPDAFRHTVERMSKGPRLELFGRVLVGDWCVWGNNVGREQFLEFA